MNTKSPIAVHPVHPVKNREAVPDAIDFSRPFMPHDLTPLSFTPAYHTLTPAQKLRYNQINALYFNEQTMFFEKALARNVLGHFLSRPLPPGLLNGLRQFLAEEEMHTAMFRQLNRLCAPRLYSNQDFHFIQTTPIAARLLDAISRHPEQFPFLLWLMQLQEERALFFGRAFLKHAATLEPHFVETQRRHLADEIGHVRWDALLLERVWAKTSPWLRRLNVRLFAWMVREYFSTPKHSAPRVVAALVAEFPELDLSELCRQLRDLAHDPVYRRSLYSPEITPATFKQFDTWPEFKLMTSAMPGYQWGTNS